MRGVRSAHGSSVRLDKVRAVRYCPLIAAEGGATKEGNVKTIDIRPTVEGMEHLLAAVAKDRDDERVLWGMRMAIACGDGWLEWYGAQVSEARGWKA